MTQALAQCEKEQLTTKKEEAFKNNRAELSISNFV